MSSLRLSSLWLSLLAMPAAGAQQVSAPISAVHYEVTADKAALADRHLGVVTTFDVAGTGEVLLSLPAWTPGAYEISDFAKWVSGFKATQDGAELKWDKLDFDTWRVRPKAPGKVTVSFSYLADSLDNAMSWTKPDFALFNGTNLFMYAEGRPLEFASTVSLKVDASFTVATGLTRAGAPHEYSATNYHDLVDMPVFVGNFDLDSATISAKTVRYATYPAGFVRGAARAQAWDQLKRIIPVEGNVFGETPWANYTLMQISDSTYGGYSGLEHSSSHVDIVGNGFVGSASQPSLYAHEIFHSWNVKRLRPADLVPYRYDRPQPTTWLWVSEGITDYYADLAQVRAGIVDAEGFYALTAAKIAEISNTIPFALEDASLNTWIHPKDGTEYSYYPKGSLAGFMLDVMIRDASNNARSLDGVMRELYESTFRKGKGFTHDEFWGAVSRAAGGRSFAEFEAKYVDGRALYPWEAILPLAGLRAVADSAPRIGVTTTVDPAGAVKVVEVAPGTSAAMSGVTPGDEIVTVGEIPVADQQFGAKFRLRFAGRAAGSPFDIVVKRGAQTVTLPAKLMYAPGLPRLAEDPNALPKAVRVRTGILQGTTRR